MWPLVLIIVSGVVVLSFVYSFQIRKKKLAETLVQVAKLEVEKQHAEKIRELEKEEREQADEFRADPHALSDYINSIVGEGDSD